MGASDATVVEREPTKAELEVKEQALSWPERAREIQVVDERTFVAASGHLKAVKELIREADRVFGPVVKKAHEAHKAAKAAEKEVKEPLLQAERVLKAAIGNYTAEQERARLAAEREAQARIEAQVRADREAAVQAANDSGNEELAQAIERAPLPPVAVTVQSSVPKVEGVQVRSTWKAHVYDVIGLLLWVAESPEDRLQYIVVNESALNQLARNTRGGATVTGVEFREHKTVAA